MFSTVRNAVLCAFIAFGTMAGLSAPASANGNVGIYFGFGTHGVRDYAHPPRYYRDHGRRHYSRGRGGCDASQALRKARHDGLRRARIIRADRRGVVVAGIERGRRDRVVYANVRGCPRIR